MISRGLITTLSSSTTPISKPNTLNGVMNTVCLLLVVSYSSTGKIEKLLEVPSQLDQQLFSFLESKPRLSWLHDIKMQQFTSCSQNTAALALSETDDLAQKKILLAIQQLSLLAADQEDVDPLMNDGNRSRQFS